MMTFANRSHSLFFVDRRMVRPAGLTLPDCTGRLSGEPVGRSQGQAWEPGGTHACA
jgi:hypothetical protein